MSFGMIMWNWNMVKKLCYMDPCSFICHLKRDDIYSDIAEVFKTTLDTWNLNLADHYQKENARKLLV